MTSIRLIKQDINKGMIFIHFLGFLKENIGLSIESLKYFYKILVLIGEDIKPSNEKSEALADYAYHCVTQSNSRRAREMRLAFLNNLFLNKSKTPNGIQIDILNYFRLSESDVIKIENYLTIDGNKLQIKVGIPKLF